MTYIEFMNKLQDLAFRYNLRLCIEKPRRGFLFMFYFVNEHTHEYSSFVSFLPEKDDPAELFDRLEKLALGFAPTGRTSDGVVS